LYCCFSGLLADRDLFGAVACVFFSGDIDGASMRFAIPRNARRVAGKSSIRALDHIWLCARAPSNEPAMVPKKFTDSADRTIPSRTARLLTLDFP
jgi:hypothetical protein